MNVHYWVWVCALSTELLDWKQWTKFSAYRQVADWSWFQFLSVKRSALPTALERLWSRTAVPRFEHRPPHYRMDDRFSVVFAADLWHIYRRKVRVLHVRWLPRRSHDDKGAGQAVNRGAMVWQCLGLHRLLQRDGVGEPYTGATPSVGAGKLTLRSSAQNLIPDVAQTRCLYLFPPFVQHFFSIAFIHPFLCHVSPSSFLHLAYDKTV